MRVLSKSECAYIGGGNGPVAPAQPIHLQQTSPTVFSGSFNGVTTTVVCTTPISFGLDLSISTKGKLVEGSAGTAFGTQECTVTTLDTKTHIESVCKGTDCKIYDLKSGKQTAEMTVENGDSGIAQLAQADSGDAIAFAGYDFGGGNYGGGGWAGGDPGGSDGPGPDIGEPEDGGGDGGMYA